MIQTFAFYMFAVLLIASAVLVIMARNPVHSVLWLIVAFFNAAGLMVLVGAEFIAMLLVIVYVGAVAVLFLFVVMMLDIDFAELRAGFMKNFPLGVAIALVLLAELVLGIGAYKAGAIALGTPDGSAAPLLGRSNIESHGQPLPYGERYGPVPHPRGKEDQSCGFRLNFPPGGKSESKLFVRLSQLQPAGILGLVR